MRRIVKQSAFSLIEMVVVLATILILTGALLGVSKYLTIRANIDLTESELEVLATAMQQYYDDFGDFPFFTTDAAAVPVTDSDSSGYLLDEYMDITITGYSVIQGAIPALAADPGFDSSAALFYFLDKNPNSRMIAEALTDMLISNKDAGGVSIQVTLTATKETIDLPRFIDAWGTSIRYEYIDGTAFPILTSAGPDKTLDTADDVPSQ